MARVGVEAGGGAGGARVGVVGAGGALVWRTAVEPRSSPVGVGQADGRWMAVGAGGAGVEGGRG